MIHTVLISYERYELTEQAVESYLATVEGEYSLIVVDNGSQRFVRQKLQNLCLRNRRSGAEISLLLLPANRYPGYAANLGWFHAEDRAELLQRADNDFLFLPGWISEVERMFAANPKLGQLGLRTDEEELFAPNNVGGNCIIRREVWESGLRYDERPWPEYPPGWTEDSYFSPAITRAGWEWDRVESPCIVSISKESGDDEYYRQSWAARRIHGHG